MRLIAGAGLAGLSAAYHLGERNYRIIEKGDRPGGLCRTEKKDGFLFDYGGHLLHVRNDYVNSLARELLGDELITHQRRASIYSYNAFTPYPFQANTYGLPAEVVRDCLVGYVQAITESLLESFRPANFREWVYYTFGKGFAEHFFMPWNQKFFKTGLDEIAIDWVSWAIPRPGLREVVNGALGIQDSEFGYNAEFYYPEDGIEALPRALAKELQQPVETGTSLVEVIPAEHRALLSTGEEVYFDTLISTVPLPELVRMVKDVPADIREAADRLRVLSVLCVNLGITGPPLTDRHWIYIPGPEYSFHRIGVYSNFTPGAEDRSSLYLEISLPGVLSHEQKAGLAGEVDKAVAEFKSLPLWDEDKHKIELADTFLIDYGYVLYDHARAECVEKILAYLRENSIEPAGRYGRWEYSTMEDAILEGREAAEAAR
ncbi:MAG: FAD-dependent oxidoreductase [bacterium]